ncbi:hypothetical protein IQ259_12095 [Fortiea sp. LEGE XX443]|uniref:dual OB domain-containing protein n=1 Tax=Fortiea sp. LEGE XX443 TaxID=1828611 RepID=UPI001882C874|nr:hypothetical protein [Fortiea sp. LEGE XX443]MBE9005768.1 hypothetical protein [Fortiea sp. LEGE XX443]
MPSLKRIVCLANSWKLKERCVAGIDLDTGRWIRPVCEQYPNDGRVPREVRLVEGREPELLDIIAIPLADTGNDFGFESENLTILQGKWQLLGKASPANLLSLYRNYPHILHNSNKYVNVSYLQSLPFYERRTLQLIHVIDFSVQPKEGVNGAIEWKGTLKTSSEQNLIEAKITDPVFVKKLESRYQITGEYLVTVSLSLPWAYNNWEGEPPCWKLIAGVIEISYPESIKNDLTAQTDQQMERIGWNVEQGRNYLQQSFNKRSRQQLTLLELTQFLNYLKSLPGDSNNLPF